jgi:uncharacterized membrane protein
MATRIPNKHTVNIFELYVGEADLPLTVSNFGYTHPLSMAFAVDHPMQRMIVGNYSYHYAKLGFRIFPQLFGHPLVSDWMQQATANLKQIRTWWDDMPLADIGIATGRNLVVLDVDPVEGGNESLAALERRHDHLPKTATVNAGGGGRRHLYFRVSADLKSRKLADGLVLRGAGSFVAAPPSKPSEGPKYQWVGDRRPDKRDFAPLPAWMVQLAESQGGSADVFDTEETESPRRLLVPFSAGVPNDKCKDALTARARLMRCLDLPQSDVEKAILAAAHSSYNPSTKTSTPFPEDEARAIVAREWRRETPYIELKEEEEPTPSLGAHDHSEKQALEREGSIPWYTEEELINRPGIAWLVDDLIPAGQPAVLYGDEGTFKSFLALDLACSVATGLPWLGRTCKQGYVLYIAGEGAEGMGPRLAAWRRKHGFPQTLKGISFQSQSIALPRGEVVDALIERVQHAFGADAALIVVDTLTRCFGEGEASLREPDDMQKFIPLVDRLARETGATVLLIHHTGWPSDSSRKKGEDESESRSRTTRRPRGPRQLVGDLSSIIEVTASKAKKHKNNRSAGLVTLKCYKLRDAPDFDPIKVNMLKVEESLVPELKQEEPADQLNETERKLVDYVSRSYGPVSQKVIRDALGGQEGFSKGNVSKVISNLVKKGVLQQTKLKGNRSPGISVTANWKDVEAELLQVSLTA